MSRQPPGAGSRPITSFGFASPAAATSNRPARGEGEEGERNGSSRSDKGKQRALEDASALHGFEGRSTRQAGANGPALTAVTAAARAFMPARADEPRASRMLEPAPAARRDPMKPSTSARSARPDVSPSTQPATKRPRRVLASQEELDEWQKEASLSRRHKVEMATATGGGSSTSLPARAGPSAARLPNQPLEPLHSVFAFASPAFKPGRLASPVAAASPSTSTRAQDPMQSPAVHRLSSLVPKPRASPAPLRPASPATPNTQRMTQLFPAPSGAKVKAEGEEKKAFGILARAPPAPKVESKEDEDENADDWSPRKKRGGLLASGIAARASALLATARTEQTLWLHDMSRRASSAGAQPLTRLAEAVQPAIRLIVVDVPSFGSDGADSFVSSDRRRDRRTLLANCRLILSDTTGASETPPAASPEKDLQGLVLFSLHERPTTTASVPPPSPPKRRPSSSSTPIANDPRTLFIPTTPPDLRLLAQPGAQIWVWEPFHEVVLATDPTQYCISVPHATSAVQQAPREGVKKEDDEEGDEMRVEWEAGAPDEQARAREDSRRRAREADRERKGLVCGRFALIV